MIWATGRSASARLPPWQALRRALPTPGLAAGSVRPAIPQDQRRPSHPDVRLWMVSTAPAEAALIWRLGSEIACPGPQSCRFGRRDGMTLTLPDKKAARFCLVPAAPGTEPARGSGASADLRVRLAHLAGRDRQRRHFPQRLQEASHKFSFRAPHFRRHQHPCKTKWIGARVWTVIPATQNGISLRHSCPADRHTCDCGKGKRHGAAKCRRPGAWRRGR